jgi:HlyD family secretion protein
MNYIKLGFSGLKIVLMIAGLLFIIRSGYQALSNSGEEKPVEASFQTGIIKRGNLETIVSSTGTLAAVGTVDIGTQVSGTIATVNVDYNDQVKKGEVLAALDLALFESAVSETKAGVAQAYAKVKQAEAEYVRNKPLFDTGNLSAQEMLSLETEKEQAKANLLSAQAALNRSMINLENAQIRSPIDGTVISRNIEAGQTVAASYSTPTLFIIAEDLSLMQIEANVDESDIGQIKLDQDVRFTVQAYPDDTFTGKVSQIRMNPTTISNVVTYIVIVDAPNKKGVLLPGMTATIDFVVARAEKALLIPNGALRFRPRGVEKDITNPAIYRIGKMNRPEKILVSLGITDGDVTVAVDETNLSEGMVIITGAQTEKVKVTKSLISRLFSRPGGRRGH